MLTKGTPGISSFTVFFPKLLGPQDKVPLSKEHNSIGNLAHLRPVTATLAWLRVQGRKMWGGYLTTCREPSGVVPLWCQEAGQRLQPVAAVVPAAEAGVTECQHVPG